MQLNEWLYKKLLDPVYGYSKTVCICVSGERGNIFKRLQKMLISQIKWRRYRRTYFTLYLLWARLAFHIFSYAVGTEWRHEPKAILDSAQNHHPRSYNQITEWMVFYINVGTSFATHVRSFKLARLTYDAVKLLLNVNEISRV